MRPLKTMVRSLLFFGTLSVLLTGCSTQTLSKFSVVSPEIPAYLRECRDAPRAPTGDFTQKEVSQFTAKLAGAYVDCKTKHGAILKIIDETKIKANQAAKAASK